MSKGEAAPVCDSHWWELLRSRLWDGYTDLDVFTEFMDEIFEAQTKLAVDWDGDGKRIFARDREKKQVLVVQAMRDLGDEMERYCFEDRIGDIHQEMASLNTVGDIPKGEEIRVSDPCGGSGCLPMVFTGLNCDRLSDFRVTCERMGGSKKVIP